MAVGESGRRVLQSRFARVQMASIVLRIIGPVRRDVQIAAWRQPMRELAHERWR